MTDDLKELVSYLKERGYLVYGPTNPTTYVYFVEQDGVRFGYAQASWMRGFEYATVHRPCKSNGTGFQARNPEQALMVVPSGFSPQLDVQKYRDFETFRKQHWQPLEEI